MSQIQTSVFAEAVSVSKLVTAGLYMLDESWESHHVLQSHPVHHLDVVVSDQLGGRDWSQTAVVKLTSHAGVTDLGWDRKGQVR